MHEKVLRINEEIFSENSFFLTERERVRRTFFSHTERESDICETADLHVQDSFLLTQWTQVN